MVIMYLSLESSVWMSNLFRTKSNAGHMSTRSTLCARSSSTVMCCISHFSISDLWHSEIIFVFHSNKHFRMCCKMFKWGRHFYLTAMGRVLLDQKIFIFWIYYDFFHSKFFQKKRTFSEKINVYFRKTACVHGKFGKKVIFWKKVFPEKVICPQKWPKWPLKRILAHVIPTKNIFCKKIGPKRSFVASAVVRPIYIRLYGATAAN